jgi:hypothetical protein
MPIYWFVLAILAVWRVTHLLNAEDGPWDLSVRLRQAAGDGFWGQLLDCFACLSLWVAAPFAYWVGNSAKERFLMWLACSAAAISLEHRRGAKPHAAASYFEHRDSQHQDDLQGDQDELLRTETRPMAK